MTNPIRAALERLVSAYDNECEGEYEELWPEFLDEPFAAARAALAQPEPEDDVVLLRAALEATAAQRRAEDDARAALAMPEPEVVFDDEDVITFWTERGGVGGVVVSPALVARARAVTPARSQPAPDAGEVAKLTAEIQHFLDGYRQIRGLDPEYIYSIHRGDAMEAHITVSGLTRTAALLQQLSAQAQAPVPVAVSERLPGVEDCDVEGKCWFFDPCDHGWWWLRSALFIDGDPDPLTHWLPAHALPLAATTPAGQENHAY